MRTCRRTSRQGLQKWCPQGVDSGCFSTCLHAHRMRPWPLRGCRPHTWKERGRATRRHLLAACVRWQARRAVDGQHLVAAAAHKGLQSALLLAGACLELLGRALVAGSAALALRGVPGPAPQVVRLLEVPAPQLPLCAASWPVQPCPALPCCPWTAHSARSCPMCCRLHQNRAHHQGLSAMWCTEPLASFMSAKASAGSGPSQGLSPASARCARSARAWRPARRPRLQASATMGTHRLWSRAQARSRCA